METIRGPSDDVRQVVDLDELRTRGLDGAGRGDHRDRPRIQRVADVPRPLRAQALAGEEDEPRLYLAAVHREAAHPRVPGRSRGNRKESESSVRTSMAPSSTPGNPG